MTSLYEMTTEMEIAIDDLMAQDVPQDVINDTIEGMKGDLKAKQLACAAYILNKESDIKEMDRYQLKMLNRSAVVSASVERLRSTLLWSLGKNKNVPVSNNEISIKVQKNPARVVVDESVIDDKFVVKKTTSAIDRIAIKEAIKNGDTIEGAKLQCSNKIVIK
jgi:hypothetical protein